MRDWFIPALLTVACWGLWGFLPKLTIQYIDARSASIIQSLGGLVVSLALFWSARFQLQTHIKGVGLAILTGILGSLGALFFTVAMSRGKMTVVLPMTSMYPAVSMLLAFVLLKETLTPKQWIGVGLAGMAIFLISS